MLFNVDLGLGDGLSCVVVAAGCSLVELDVYRGVSVLDFAVGLRFVVLDELVCLSSVRCQPMVEDHGMFLGGLDWLLLSNAVGVLIALNIRIGVVVHFGGEESF